MFFGFKSGVIVILIRTGERGRVLEIEDGWVFVNFGVRTDWHEREELRLTDD
jgi:hypothetical protein